MDLYFPQKYLRVSGIETGIETCPSDFQFRAVYTLHHPHIHAYSTRYSKADTHLSTDHGWLCLTSMIIRGGMHFNVMWPLAV